MGKAPEYENEGKEVYYNWYRPPESMDDGCPGGWYRCAFVRSLDMYLPTRSGEGWLESPIRAQAPRFVIEAVQSWKKAKAIRDSEDLKAYDNGKN